MMAAIIIALKILDSFIISLAMIPKMQILDLLILS
jgi:hypothetical protein